ncbi:MAG: RsmD family RNA methyltransferase [Burkholderiaceae bacterium]
MQVRIIGGQWKRTPLPVPDAPGLRPSPDRVRVTAFNWIEHFFPDVGALSGLDLFAGTGALGFELASRGAARVTLVERNPVLVAALQRTKQKLNAEGVTIVAGDALAYVHSVPDRSFDIVFLDPPFDGDLLQPALEAASRVVSPHGAIYAESGTPLEAKAAAKCGLRIVRAARAGHVHFHLLQRA